MLAVYWILCPQVGILSTTRLVMGDTTDPHLC